MKLKESNIRELVREFLQAQYKTNPDSVIKLSQLSESSDFVARREIQASIDKLVLDIEKDIILKALDVVDPNKLDPKLQAAYLKISEEMKNGIKLSIQNAVKKLAPFPRNSDEKTTMGTVAHGAGIVKESKSSDDLKELLPSDDKDLVEYAKKVDKFYEDFIKQAEDLRKEGSELVGKDILGSAKVGERNRFIMSRIGLTTKLKNLVIQAAEVLKRET